LKNVFAALAALIMVVSAFAVLNAVGVGVPEIRTDKPDYLSGEIVTITGSNFTSNAIVAITVVAPDGTATTGTVLSDGSGGFVYFYPPPGQVLSPSPLPYVVTATDAMGLSATTTFTDGTSWMQGQNDSNADDVPDGTLKWITGDLGKIHHIITEGNYPPPYPPYIPGQVDYRAIFEGLTPGDYVWNITYMFTKSGHSAFDFLTTSYMLTNTDPILYNDLTGDLLTEVTGLVSAGPDIYKFPYDTFNLPAALDLGQVKDRQIQHDLDLTGLTGTVPIRSLRMYGGDITNIVVSGHDGPIDGDSEASVLVYFTQDDSSSIVATWGGHIGIGQPAPLGYGTGMGAQSISGSPYHMIFKAIYYYDSTAPLGVGEPVKSMGGDMDRSMKAEAVVVLSTVTGYKWNDANGNGVWDAGELPLANWEITIDNGALLQMTAATDSTGYYQFMVPVGSYTVSETKQTGWLQTFPASPGTHSVSVTGSGMTLGPYNFGNQFLEPAITVVKTGPTYAYEGDTITYTIVVTNTGNCVLYEVTVVDDILGDLGTIAELDVGAANAVTLHPTYTVPTPQIPNVDNTVTVDGSDALDTHVTDSDSWSVDILHPAIEVAKSADKSCAAEGEDVTYTITVTNPASTDVAIDWFTVSDAALGWSETWGVDPDLDLAPGEHVDFTVVKAMPVQTADFVNVADVVGYDIHGKEVTDLTPGSWTVDIVHPAVEITKTADKSCAAEGEDVTYTITVKNPSSADIALDWFTATDSKLVWTVTWTDNLAPGQSKSFTVTVQMPSQEADFVNTASVTAYDMQGHEVTAVSNSWTVDIVHPDIEITKTADKTCAAEGEAVTYTITVKNPSTADIAIDWFTVSDSLLGWSETWGVSPDLDLAPGEHVDFTVVKAMPEQTGDFVNTAGVIGYDMQGHEVTGTSNSWTVDIVHPDVEVSKSADKSCAAVGEEVTYTITVTNPASADIALDSFVVTDTLLGWSATWGVDPDLDLAPGNSISFTVKTTMPGQFEDFVNTASVVAYDMQGHEVTATSNSWTVDIVYPDVEISKTADKTCAAEGEEVTYTITVTNPASADIALDWFTVTDLQLGWSETWGVDPDLDLAPGQHVDFTVKKTMPIQTEDFVNTASVVAYDMQGHEVTAVSNSWTVDIVHPAVQISKAADKTCAAEGEIVTYVITVTNPASADIALDWFTVSDSMLGWSETWGVDPDSDLAPGNSVSFTVPKAMPTQTADFVNTASVVAYDMQLHELKATSNSWTVDIVHPDIDISKTADKSCAAEGEEVTYTITVTNPASTDIAIDWFVVSDAMLGGWTATWGLDPDLDLAPGQHVDFTVLYDMPVQTEDFVNIAEVTGYDMQEHEVKATSNSWTVDVVHPDVEITKTADKSCAAEGEEVTYTITVTNPASADIALDSFVVTDTLLGWSATWGVDPDLDLAPGEHVDFTVKKAMPVQDEDFVNAAFVDALDMQGHLVSEVSDAWIVDIVHPDIDISKSGPEFAHELDVVTYTIVVTNPASADIAIASFVVTDGGVDLVGGYLGIGESQTFTVAMTMPPGTSFTNTVTVTAYDMQEHKVTDSASWTVILLHPAITIEKTGPTMVHPGDLVTYELSVENTGDCTLYGVVVDDPLTGNTFNVGTLGVGGTWSATVTTVAGTSDLLNKATVDGSDILGGDKGYVSAEATWPTEVLIPAIEIDKTADPTMIHNGDMVTYTFVVTNIGNCDLSGITVVDNKLGDLTSHLTVTTLAPGESTSFDVTVPIGADVTNTATTTGTDDLGETVSDTDDATVDVLNPEITVTKSGPAYAHFGDVITYTITVENTGDCVLTDVTVIDSLLGDLTSYLPDTTLDIGEINTITVTFTVNIEKGDLLNTVIASGTDELDLTVDDEASHKVAVLLQSVVTDTSFCYFDVDPDAEGQQFRLIFTPYESKYKLSASNPGQFYYNVFYVGTPGDEVQIDIQIPYPFVTNGAQPVHVYGGYDLADCSADWPWVCFLQLDPLTGFEISGPSTTASGFGIALGDYSPQAFGSTAVMSVSGTVPESGLIYVTVHVEYGLKGTTGYGKNSVTLEAIGGLISIPNLQGYMFAWQVGSEWVEPTVYSENVFKKDPGIAGFTKRADGITMVPNVPVDVRGPGVTARVWSDDDGWYMFQYKYTGKPTTFKLTAGGVTTSVYVKSNSYNLVDLVLPDGYVPPAKTTDFVAGGTAGSAAGTTTAGIAALAVSCILVGILGAAWWRFAPLSRMSPRRR